MIMTENAFLEIERKFLVDSLPTDYADYPSKVIAQTYLSRPGVPPVLRVRQYGEEFLLTVKKRDEKNPMVCGEVEIPIGEREYGELKAMGEGRDLEKTRYFIPWGARTVELDIFGGNLSGLALAEIEFTSREEAENATFPDWFGKEVTGDLTYSNNSLSEKGLPEGYGQALT